MPNLIARHWDRIVHGLQRRKNRGRTISQIEQLESRVVLTRGSGAGIGAESDVAALVAVEPSVDAAANMGNARSAATDAPANSRKNPTVIDIKQWQGTWNVTTDIPFLGGGTIQIHQISATKFEATTTGMRGNQFYALKTLQSGSQLHFKIKGTDLEGKPKTVGFQVELDTTGFASFSGFARVAGDSGHDHSISATLQNGTAPTSSNVEVYFHQPRTTVKAKDGVGTFKLDMGVLNLGTAPIRANGLDVVVTFTGDFQPTDLIDVFKFRFTDYTQNMTSPGQLTITFHTSSLYSDSVSGAAAIITLTTRSNFTITATARDGNENQVPTLGNVIKPDPLAVTLK